MGLPPVPHPLLDPSQGTGDGGVTATGLCPLVKSERLSLGPEVGEGMSME